MNVLVVNSGKLDLKCQVITTDVERVGQDQEERICAVLLQGHCPNSVSALDRSRSPAHWAADSAGFSSACKCSHLAVGLRNKSSIDIQLDSRWYEMLGELVNIPTGTLHRHAVRDPRRRSHSHVKRCSRTRTDSARVAQERRGSKLELSKH
jgi:hypothetical protein